MTKKMIQSYSEKNETSQEGIEDRLVDLSIKGLEAMFDTESQLFFPRQTLPNH